MKRKDPVKRKDSAKTLRCPPRAHARVYGIARRHRIPIGRAVELLCDAWENLGRDAQYRVLTGETTRMRTSRKAAAGLNGAENGVARA